MPILPRILAAACPSAGMARVIRLFRAERSLMLLVTLVVTACRSAQPVSQSPVPTDTVIAVPPMPPVAVPVLEPDSAWYVIRSLTTTREPQAQLLDSARYQERVRVVLQHVESSRWVLNAQSDSGYRRADSQLVSQDTLNRLPIDTVPLLFSTILGLQKRDELVITSSRDCASAQSLLSPLVVAVLHRHLVTNAREAIHTLRYTTCYPEAVIATTVEISSLDRAGPRDRPIQHRIRIILSADSSKFLPMTLSGHLEGSFSSFGAHQQLPDSLMITAAGELFFKSALREQRIQQLIQTVFHRDDSKP